jgi:autophagy-related protein 17
MATTPSHRSSRSVASSTSADQRNSLSNIREGGHDAALDDEIPVETLVEHLLAAKRSLSSMTLVLRANEISTAARQAHEEAVILSAQSEYLRRAISDQATILIRVRRSLGRTYKWGSWDLKHMLKAMDSTDGQLQSMMDILRSTTVDPVFRPQNEDPKHLIDFLDEKSVHGVRDSLKRSIGELQVSQFTRHAPLTT